MCSNEGSREWAKHRSPFPLPFATFAPLRPLREKQPENRAIGAGEVFSSLFSFVMIGLGVNVEKKIMAVCSYCSFHGLFFIGGAQNSQTDGFGPVLD